MQRRSFLSFATTLAGVACLYSQSGFALSLANNKLNQSTQRWSLKQFAALGIKVPQKAITTVDNMEISVNCPPLIVRQYDTRLYVYYDLQAAIYVYDLNGVLLKTIPLLEQVKGLKDFAVDLNRQVLLLVERGSEAIRMVDFDLQELQRIYLEPAPTHSTTQLPRSLTIDALDRLHIVFEQQSEIFVYSMSGAFLFTYLPQNQNQLLRLSSIDGNEQIVISGGVFNDRQIIKTVDGEAF
ncbi:hypothetical protein ACFOEE_03625 [Pseudoalteromonas fenneropenaei]|uniref:Uncharacterized protein n=1 Tax=Pseudoalteromonas fenneropenaei TaxID=1737459 RepID=A0ABV7CGE5_9GAMM